MEQGRSLTAPPDGPYSDLIKASNGVSEGCDLLEQVYDHLRAIARVQLAREAPGHTLQPTALVHEAYLRLRNHASLFGSDRGRLYRAAALAMRRVLADYARGRKRVKRGSGSRRVFADVAQLAANQDPDEILALEEAIGRLEQREPFAAQVVQLRFFAGMEIAQTALALGVSERTVKREWQFARAWLYRAME